MSLVFCVSFSLNDNPGLAQSIIIQIHTWKKLMGDGIYILYDADEMIVPLPPIHSTKLHDRGLIK